MEIFCILIRVISYIIQRRGVCSLVQCVFFLLSSCQSTEQQTLTESEKQEIADTIREQSTAWLHSIDEATQENLDIFLDYFVDSNEAAWMNKPALWVGNLQMLLTREQLEEFWHPIFDRRASHTAKIVNDYVAVLSADLAVHVVQFNFTITDTQGNTSDEHIAVITNVYAKKNNVWKILHHHQSFE